MKKSFLILLLLSLCFIGCSNDDDKFTVTEASLNGTWKASLSEDGPIGVPSDRNNRFYVCPNKPDSKYVVNELLIAFTNGRFFKKIDETKY